MQQIEKRYERLIAYKHRLQRERRSKRKELKRVTQDVENHLLAKLVLTEVARNMQVQAKERIEKLITIAIRSVYDDRDFTFELVSGENKNSMTPVIKEGDNIYNPKDELGGGIIDIISFASRVILWSMERPRSMPIFVLDEPFKWTGALMERAGAMLKQLSHDLGFQVVLVSHDEALIEICDRVWSISHNGIKSEVKLIKGRILNRRKGV